MISTFRIGAWCFPLVIVKEDILQGQELSISYGQEYWELFLDHQLEQAAADAERAENQENQDALKKDADQATARAEAAEASAARAKGLVKKKDAELKELERVRNDQAVQMAAMQRRINQQDAKLKIQGGRNNMLRKSLKSSARALAEDTKQQEALENLGTLADDDRQ